MNDSASPVIFFDIGGTLASPTLTSSPPRLERLAVYPYVPGMLRTLRDRGNRLGVIANTGDETAQRLRDVLERSGLYAFFEPDLLVYSSVEGIGTSTPEIFRRASARAGHAAAPNRCVFVGEDSSERRFALEAGLVAAPHPRLAQEVVDGARLRYVRVSISDGARDDRWRAVIADLPVVPLYARGVSPVVMYAITSDRGAARLDDLGFGVDRLGRATDPLTTDLHLLYDDRRTRTGYLDPEGQSVDNFAAGERADWVLSSASEGLFVALPADRSVQDLHFAEVRHGHGVKLIPNMTLLLQPGAGPAAPLTGLRDLGSEPARAENLKVETFEEITAQALEGYLKRYTGERPIDEMGTRIESRHVDHPHNLVAVDALARDLEELGGDQLSVHRHEFDYGDGRKLHNVWAELRGERSDEFVLVTAHLDSTAKNLNDPLYRPHRDPAPGADDDASGTAGVLVIARAMVKRAQASLPKRSIRFVLFNAEEQHLAGSQAYARDQAERHERIVAVFQMDMIGYNKTGTPRTWDLHIGVDGPTHPPGDPSPLELLAEERAKDLADAARRMSELVAPRLETPPIFTSPQDEAAGRSDHYSFQHNGYAACLFAEDFQQDSQPSDFNPNYHTKFDTFVDAEYAADIARVVAATAWATANA